ncbi:hypothetical protein ACWGPW_22645 [Paenibacillus chitinolyticus]
MFRFEHPLKSLNSLLIFSIKGGVNSLLTKCSQGFERVNRPNLYQAGQVWAEFDWETLTDAVKKPFTHRHP